MLQFACSQLSTAADFFAYGCNCSLQSDDAADVQTVNDAIDAASDMIAMLSGGRISGRCMRTVYPFGEGGGCLPYGHWDHPAGIFGTWGVSQIPFAGHNPIPLRGPNTEIVEVRIGGAVVAPTAYRIVNYEGSEYLVRIDGTAWPSINNFDSTNANSWTFTERFGRGPDKITRDAVDELACELAKDAAGRKSLLPLGVKNLNLQGASASLEDAADALRDGSENMPAVARFLGIYNPNDDRNPPGIMSPELMMGWQLYVVTGPSGS